MRTSRDFLFRFSAWASRSIRLRNGAYPWEGGVEVFHNAIWGSVCDDHFDVSDAQVVCRSMGYPSVNPLIHTTSYYGHDMGPFWIDELRCTGTETSVALCDGDHWGQHDCDQNEYVGVNCRPDIPTVPVRLVGGAQVWEGRLEVLNNGNRKWGTVCDDMFNEIDAMVVCRMLGYLGSPPQVQSSTIYGQGTGDILLDDVRCSGTEQSIFNCQHRGLGVHDCSHGKDVGINCQPSAPQTVVRLVNGENVWEGRLEVWNAEKWGTVCSNNFDIKDATVICWMLGFHVEQPSVRSTDFYGAGTGFIWLDNLECRGTEDNIFRCPHRGLGVTTCTHSSDVGVNCQPSAPSTVVRIVSGIYPWEGRVEVWNSAIWGTVCQDSFDVFDARVVCNGLRYFEDTPIVLFNATFGQGSGPIALDDVGCRGTEKNLFYCPQNGSLALRCNHSRDVGVNCLPSAPSPAIRLVNGSQPWMGRVELWANKTWGTVCYDNFDTNDARVVCRMLGFMADQPVVYSPAQFGQGSGTIWLDNVNCNGSEPTLFQCTHNGLGVIRCQHSGDVGINCQPSAPLLPVRLVNGKQPWEGRIEVWSAGSWGTICDDGFDVIDARVVCLNIGYTSVHPGVVNNSYFGQGTGTIWLAGLECLGSEQNIFMCPHNGLGISNCSHSQDAGVNCQTLAPYPAVRLSNGLFPWEGRIEVWNDGSWGTICSYNFDVNDARVVCRMLGFNGEDPTVSYYNQSTGRIWLDNVGCQGSEDNILLCQHRGLGTYNCSNSKYAGTNCYPSAPSDVVRLAGGLYPWVGRVEVWNRGAWGTVCENGFDKIDTSVVCKSLGYIGDSPVVSGSQYYGEGVGTVWMDDVACQGTEANILKCPYTLPETHQCNHSHDVGINCQPSAPSPPVRLVNGRRPGTGRVEVWNNGSWGTVCSINFDVDDVAVLCKMLNYTGVQPLVKTELEFGQGIGPIWLGDLGCVGLEQSIFLCRQGDLDAANCSHSKDVGIDCDLEDEVTMTTEQTDFTVYIGIGSGVFALIIVVAVVAIIIGRKRNERSTRRQHNDTQQSYATPDEIINAADKYEEFINLDKANKGLGNNETSPGSPEQVSNNDSAYSELNRDASEPGKKRGKSKTPVQVSEEDHVYTNISSLQVDDAVYQNLEVRVQHRTEEDIL